MEAVLTGGGVRGRRGRQVQSGSQVAPQVGGIVRSFIALTPVLIRRHRCQGAEQAVRLVIDAGSEEERVAAAGGMVIADFQSPQAVNLNRVAVGVFELTLEGTV